MIVEQNVFVRVGGRLLRCSCACERIVADSDRPAEDNIPEDDDDLMRGSSKSDRIIRCFWRRSRWPI